MPSQEFNGDYPMARHSGFVYTTSTKNVYFVVRAVYTVGNYDCMHPRARLGIVRVTLTAGSLDMFSYEFYLDGSIQVSVRASGVIRTQYAAGNEEYGYVRTSQEICRFWRQLLTYPITSEDPRRPLRIDARPHVKLQS